MTICWGMGNGMGPTGPARDKTIDMGGLEG
jgi:hypothetical protein